MSFPFVVNLLPTAQTDQEGATVAGQFTIDQVDTVILTGISVAIALVAAIRAFYSWDTNWQLFANQQLAVELTVRRWEITLAALTGEHEAASKRVAFEATREAINDIETLLYHEQDVFFGSMRLPEEILKKRKDEDGPFAQTEGRAPASEDEPS